MQIKIYKSALCPRCAYLIHTVKKIKIEFPEIEIVTYDLATDLKSFKEANIKMIPTMCVYDKKMSWILPKSSEIKDFILENRFYEGRSASQTASGSEFSEERSASQTTSESEFSEERSASQTA